MSEKINAQDILFVYGENDWSVVWHKDTGEALKWGDHDNVYDWLVVALGIEQPDFVDTDWYDAAARRPMPLADCWSRKRRRLHAQQEAETLRQQARELREKADKLDTQAIMTENSV